MNRSNKYLALWIILPLITIVLYHFFSQKPVSVTTISYTEFLAMVDAEHVREVIMQEQDLFITDVNGKRLKVFAPKDSDLIRILKQKGVAIKVKPPAGRAWYMSLLFSWGPMILLIGVWIFFMRKMQGGGGNPLSFDELDDLIRSMRPGIEFPSKSTGDK